MSTFVVRPVSVTLLGCGNMGSAMLDLWLECGCISHAHIITPSPIPERFSNRSNVSYDADCSKGESIATSDVFVIAVKPQIIKEALKNIEKHIALKCCILSIAAGKTLTTLSGVFKEEQPIIRAMPNTPSAIGKGISAAIANKYVNQEQRNNVSSLLEALGNLHWIEDEGLMDAVTALSGGGPAYVFYLIEILEKVGKDIGLSPDISRSLARQTFTGSAALVEHYSDIPVSTLRENVTSPGGTTMEALKVLMDGRLENLFRDALKAAKERCKKLEA